MVVAGSSVWISFKQSLVFSLQMNCSCLFYADLLTFLCRYLREICKCFIKSCPESSSWGWLYWGCGPGSHCAFRVKFLLLLPFWCPPAPCLELLYTSCFPVVYWFVTFCMEFFTLYVIQFVLGWCSVHIFVQKCICLCHHW